MGSQGGTLRTHTRGVPDDNNEGGLKMYVKLCPLRPYTGGSPAINANTSG